MYFYIFVYIFHWFSFIPTAATVLNFANVVQRLPRKRCLFFYSFLFEVWANCLGNFKVASHAYSANTSTHTRIQGDMCVQWVLSQCSLCRCSFVLAAGRLVSYLLYCNSLMSRITMSSSCHAPRGSSSNTHTRTHTLMTATGNCQQKQTALSAGNFAICTGRCCLCCCTNELLPLRNQHATYTSLNSVCMCVCVWLFANLPRRL